MASNRMRDLHVLEGFETFLVSGGQAISFLFWPLTLVTAVAVSGGCRRVEQRPSLQPEAVEITEAQPLPGPEFLAAAHDGDVETIQNALARGTAVDWRDEDGQTALMLGAFNGHLEIVKCLLDAGASVDARNSIGRTALMFAVTLDRPDTIALLLGAGADVDAFDAGEKWTPLMFAAAEGHRDVVQQLLDHGAEPGVIDEDGDDASAFASRRGHHEVANLLREASGQVRKPR